MNFLVFIALSFQLLFIHAAAQGAENPCRLGVVYKCGECAPTLYGSNSTTLTSTGSRHFFAQVRTCQAYATVDETYACGREREVTCQIPGPYDCTACETFTNEITHTTDSRYWYNKDDQNVGVSLFRSMSSCESSRLTDSYCR